MAAPMNALEMGIPSTGESSTVNILIVDDLPEKLLVFQSILEDLDQNLVMVRSGQDALRKLLEHEFAVILLDVNMPDIDGFETAALIRQYKKTAQTPIIFITAYADDIQTARGYSLGAVDYITTPVIPEILRSKVKVFVDLYRMNRQVLLWAQEREALVRAEAARAAAEEATRRADFLAEASHMLTRSLDGDSIIRSLLNLMVPKLADIVVLTLVDGHGAARRTDCIAHHAGMLLDNLQAVHIDSEPSVDALVRDVLARGENLTIATKCQWRISSAVADVEPGGVVVQRVTGLPLRTGTQVLGVLLLADSPARGLSAAEDALRHELVSRAAIAIENGLLYSTIQEGDRRKNEFLAMLAHELRNPLAPIRNAVHIVQHLKLNDPKLEWSTDIISRQVSHITHIVDDLLDVSRIARGKVVIEKAVITLDSVIRQSLETSRPHIDAKQHVLHVHAPTGPVFIEGDLVRLTQVFSNLLNNAAKYTPPGGEIHLDARVANGTISVAVRDNGEGVTAEFLPYLFDLFSQAHQAIDRTQGGLGVGLTLVKQLVELHGGSVEARSEGHERGTEFIVHLPLHEAVVDRAAPVSPRSLGAGSARDEVRVLIVDDLVAAADSMRLVLEMKNYQVRTAYDGLEAIDIARSFFPDVILLDIGLPHMDGYEVARQLRGVPQDRPALLVALTGYGQSADRTQAIAAGFDAHLIKPADIDTLCNLIEEHCENPQRRVQSSG
jgi:signal transduction histidine kinase/DNA-binding response OmpR family regulator